MKLFKQDEGHIVAFTADPIDLSVWVSTKEIVKHIDAQGRVLLTKSFKVPPIRHVLLYRDTIPPELSITAPTEGAVLDTITPTIALRYSDIGSGVDVSTLVIKANDTALSVTCNFETEAASCTPVTPLAQGPVTLTATLKDFAGNASEVARVSFTILSDRTPPSLSFVNPVNDSTINTRHPNFQIAFDDGTGSGIDPATFRLVLNGVDVTASAIVTATGATYTTGSPLPSGDNAVSAQIADRAGNVQTAAINFTGCGLRGDRGLCADERDHPVERPVSHSR